jgi:hypothetical protein
MHVILSAGYNACSPVARQFDVGAALVAAQMATRLEMGGHKGLPYVKLVHSARRRTIEA